MGNNLNKEENNEDKKVEQTLSKEDASQEKLKELRAKADLLEKRLLDKFAYPLDSNSLYYQDIPILFQGENIILHT